jgi:DNA-binding GntR family transcriptional regulator
VLTRLERTGLVTQDVNKRWYAGPLSEELLREHFEMRCLLEPIALAQVIAEIPKEEVAEKHERAIRASRTRHTLEKIERLERDLHVEIILRCSNSQLRETIRRSQLVLIAIHHSFDLYRDAGVIGVMIAEHTAILGHIRGGRPAAARKALETHLNRSLEQNIELMRQLGPLPVDRRPPYLLPVGD